MKPDAMLKPAGQACKAKRARPMGSGSRRLPARRAARSGVMTLWIRADENRTMHPKCGLKAAVLTCSARWCAHADESRFRFSNLPEMNFGPEAEEDTEMAASV